MLVFRVGAEDAPLLTRELDIDLEPDPSDMDHDTCSPTNTPNFSAWTKLIVGGAPAEARRLLTEPAEPSTHGRLQAVRNHTRARHMRSREWIEDRINRFLAPPPPRQKRPATPGRARMTISWPTV